MASSSRVPLKAFLATAKKALSAPPSQRQNPLTFVIGNESAGEAHPIPVICLVTDKKRTACRPRLALFGRGAGLFPHLHAAAHAPHPTLQLAPRRPRAAPGACGRPAPRRPQP